MKDVNFATKKCSKCDEPRISPWHTYCRVHRNEIALKNWRLKGNPARIRKLAASPKKKKTLKHQRRYGRTVMTRKARK